MYVFTQPFHYKENVTQSKIFSGVQPVLNSVFPSKLIPLPRLENFACPTIYL